MPKKIDENFFNEWNENSCYVLGFFLADGNIFKDKHCYSYKLSFYQKDPEILIKIMKVMKSGHKLSMRLRCNRFCYSFQVSNNNLTNKLINLGYKGEKTSAYVPLPSNIPDNLINHLFRGYLDGDGHIGKYKIQIDFVEVTRIHGQFIDILNKLKLPIPRVEYKKLTYGRTVQIVRLVWNNYIDRKIIRNWLYKKATIFLERKRNKAFCWKDPNIKRIAVGDTFGKLTTIKKEVVKGTLYWLCKCECGNFKYLKSKRLNSGKHSVCSCFRKKYIQKRKESLCPIIMS